MGCAVRSALQVYEKEQSWSLTALRTVKPNACLAKRESSSLPGTMINTAISTNTAIPICTFRFRRKVPWKKTPSASAQVAFTAVAQSVRVVASIAPVSQALVSIRQAQVLLTLSVNLARKASTPTCPLLLNSVSLGPVSPDRISLLVLIPITVGIVFAVITLFYWKGLCFKELKKNKVLQLVETEPQEPPGKHPQENDEDPFPVQETLLRGQPVTQEDGKESRISEQEGQ
ncbi:tumor necrosis factor receptor superfamily member 5 isoform X3 [Monodelphis domestica]|uniref:tumor necrosis factor receptor superfamily member 5 isoform X3 n=1 Tax=Monodelphis domestica TaxID=13616 RepID=UPI0024E24B31|nr:tumor necrosis factor receptor superfamily member 5 isoform X3 [Monodelphis domestica]